MKRSAVSALGVAAVIVLAGCLGPSNQKMVTVDGSSTVFPVSAAVAELFQNETPDITVEIRYSGTGGGFKKLCRGELDICDASRPISRSEIEEAKKNGIEYLELPICFDALTVVINPKNDWAEKMTIEELGQVWHPDGEKRVTRWSQINSEWPDGEFVLFGAGTDSGTFDYFTEAVTGKSGRSRKDFTPSEDDNVLVTGVAGNKDALGYFGFAYYDSNRDRLKAVAVRAKGKKEYVSPSQEAILDGSYTPLSRPLFVYVSKLAMGQKPEVRAFVEFYLANVAKACETVKYVPLPKDAYAVVRERVEKGKTGTAFGGEPAVGLAIGDVLKREPK